MPLRTILKLTLLIIWVVLNKISIHAQPSLKKINQWVYTKLEGRVIAWEYGNKTYLVEQPMSLTIPFRDGMRIPQIGLVHSGYTKKDPDGKNAVLTISYKLANYPLTQKDRDSLIQQGFIFDKLSFSNTAVKWFLDIELPLDKDEELRLRKKLELPKALTSGNSSSFQIKWNNVKGQKLYDWFTLEKGLRFKIYSDLEVNNKIEWKTHLNTEKFEKWWQDNHNGDTLFWQGGPEVLLHRLINDEVITIGYSDSIANILKSWANELILLSIKQDNNVLSITKQKLLSVDWIVTLGYCTFKASIPMSYNSPGRILKANINLVKDLSGGFLGLDALLKDNN